MKPMVLSFIALLSCLALVGCGQQKKAYKYLEQEKIQSQIEELGKDHKVESLAVFQNEEARKEPTIECRDFMKESLWYLAHEETLSYEQEEEIIAGIVPHHDIAYRYMTSFYQRVKEVNKEEPEVVLLIGPNHQAEGPRFQLGNYSYNTYDGLLTVPEDAKSLMDDYYLNEGIYQVWKMEHSVGIHMPYIKRYFQNAKVLPIIIGESHNMDGIQEVAMKLADYLRGKEYLIIASIDFSHYLSLEEAEEKDAYTREILLASDADSMIGLNSDYLDSPSSYALLITLLEALQDSYQTEITAHDNMAKIYQASDIKETTSYFQVIYTDGHSQ